MDPRLASVLNQLRSVGWTVRFRPEKLSLPVFVRQRYPWLNAEVESFLCETELVCDAAEQCWFLSSADFHAEASSAYAWNEWELQSLEAAGDDLAWSSSIREFWNNHFPIALVVGDDYGYYAIRKDGAIVYGREPEFEEPEIYAASLTGLIERLVSICKAPD